MPAAPAIVQVPPWADSLELMTILRESRLAQFATIDQQRELMRYMQGLNGWLEQDTHDRHSELRRVLARLDELRDDLRGILASVQVVRTTRPSTSGGNPPDRHHQPQPFRPRRFSESQMPTPHHFEGLQMRQPRHVTELPPGFQPFPTQPVIPPVIPAEYHTPTPSFSPVIPPVIPAEHHTSTPPFTPFIPPVSVAPAGHRTPTPPFTPVIPQMPYQRSPFNIYRQPDVPVIPTDSFRPPSRMRPTSPQQHEEEPPIPFIPPPLTGSQSAGSLRQYSMLMRGPTSIPGYE